jgi:hypothetical protein
VGHGKQLIGNLWISKTPFKKKLITFLFKELGFLPRRPEASPKDWRCNVFGTKKQNDRIRKI